MYMTASEWKEMGGKKKKRFMGYKSLPFQYCSLTFTPFSTPVTSLHGYIYDYLHILPYLKKHKTDPCTGKALVSKQLVFLKITDLNSQNEEEPSKGRKRAREEKRFGDPITRKEFNDHSHIVAVVPTKFMSLLKGDEKEKQQDGLTSSRITATVYMYETIKKLNIERGNWTDLVSNETFSEAGIIELQNPEKKKAREYENFAHVTEHQQSHPAGKAKAEKGTDSERRNIRTNYTADRILLKAKQQEQSSGVPKSLAAFLRKDDGLTSYTNEEMVKLDVENQTRWRALRKLKKKGYAKVLTSLGDLNLELHFDMAPICCENFVRLAKQGYFNGMTFHKLIPYSYIVAGLPDPSSTGSSYSVYRHKDNPRGYFKDEVNDHKDYLHSTRGVVSMFGEDEQGYLSKNKNTSIFMITFKPLEKFNKRCSVFGRVVGGTQTLTDLECQRIHQDKSNRPVFPIKIEEVRVLVNPLDELEKNKEIEEKEKKAALGEETELRNFDQARQEREKLSKAAESKDIIIGKYLGAGSAASSRSKKSAASTGSAQRAKPSSKQWTFDDW